MKQTIFKKGLKGFAQKKYPFEEVKIVSFSYTNTLTKEETAFLQYQLLLNQGVLQAHLEYSTKQGILVGLITTDFSSELKKLGLEVKFNLVEWMTYKEFVEKNSR
ncbi:MAG: hypothetical protein WCW13_05745 [archaeon]|jgi:hypothetical protein